MGTRSGPESMLIRLEKDNRSDYAVDIGPCTICTQCRPDITEMVAKTDAKFCIVCNKESPHQCSRCHDARYCSAECQRVDWPVHKLVCEQFTNLASSARPSKKHFRVIILPYEESKPMFCWALTKGSDKLVVEHDAITRWNEKMKSRYKESDKGPLVIHALSQDLAMKGKMLGHGLRVASWKPSDGKAGHMEGFNETAMSLSSVYSSRKYGPLVAFAYSLDADFQYKQMNDMTTNDFRHVVDYLNNSQYNPTVGDISRYPRKTVPALLVPDPATRKPSPSICDILGHGGIHSQIIPAKANLKQACFHVLCQVTVSPIRELCLSGAMWQTFLLGPLLLDLPWMGRNMMVTDVHNQSSRNLGSPARWDRSNCRFLGQGARLGNKVLTIQPLPIIDELIVFNPFGHEVHELHLRAYNEFIRGKLSDKDEASGPKYTKEEFSKFWDQLAAKGAKVTMQDKNRTVLDFAGVPSPYDALTEGKTVLLRATERAFRFVKGLFEDERFRNFISKYEREMAFVKPEIKVPVVIPEELWDDGLEDLHPQFNGDKDVQWPPPPDEPDERVERGQSTRREPTDEMMAEALSKLAAASLTVMRE